MNKERNRFTLVVAAAIRVAMPDARIECRTDHEIVVTQPDGVRFTVMISVRREKNK